MNKTASIAVCVIALWMPARPAAGATDNVALSPCDANVIWSYDTDR